MTLGEKIQTLRKQKGLSQEQLAEKITVSRQAVSKWELSESFPDVDNIVQLSNIFDVSTDYLLRNGAAASIDDSQKEKPAAESTVSAKRADDWDDWDEDEEPTTIKGFFHSEIYFIALIVFLIVGFVWNLWHPGWIVFLIASAISDLIEDISSALVYIAAIALFLIMGFVWNLWHPGWIIFLIAAPAATLIRIIRNKQK